ncbi:hypothetical protein Salat_1873200 [Sesamum alatum]|uniref:Uncharacterized protein n=1 Tax=Sesamum alatum TaxID=300844 RepID=A0AAE1Y354_9LAMI|nr:hypothetical protein Salat_1873200 [Sesamum alatum]
MGSLAKSLHVASLAATTAHVGGTTHVALAVPSYLSLIILARSLGDLASFGWRDPLNHPTRNARMPLSTEETGSSRWLSLLSEGRPRHPPRPLLEALVNAGPLVYPIRRHGRTYRKIPFLEGRSPTTRRHVWIGSNRDS